MVVLQSKNLPKFWEHEFFIEAAPTKDKKKIMVFILDRDGEDIVKPYVETKSTLKSNVMKKIHKGRGFTNAPRLYTGVGM